MIINDAITKPQKSMNPYLPSKLSDYAGSESSIWALYEKDCVLSQKKNVKHFSELGCIDESVSTMQRIINE